MAKEPKKAKATPSPSPKPSRQPVATGPKFCPNKLQRSIMEVLTRSNLLGSGDVARSLKLRQGEVMANLAILEHHGIVTHYNTNWRIVKKNG